MIDNDIKPWDVLGCTQEEYEADVAIAASEGLIKCTLCQFKMYKKTCRKDNGEYHCPKCNKNFSG